MRVIVLTPPLTTDPRSRLCRCARDRLEHSQEALGVLITRHLVVGGDVAVPREELFEHQLVVGADRLAPLPVVQFIKRTCVVLHSFAR